MSFTQKRSSSIFTPNNDRGGCICLCDLKFKSQKDDKCPEHLKRWELWMRRRKRIHEMLATKLRKKPGDLLMNSGDGYRTIQEEKAVLEYTRIESHFDKYRGNPEFWKLPWALRDKWPPYARSDCFVVKPKSEKGEIPEIEYVGVPDYILEEKGIMPRTRKLRAMWNKSTYRRQVMERVGEKLLEIEPHKPDISTLLVIGSNSTNKIKSTVRASTTPRIRSTSENKKLAIPEVQELLSEIATQTQSQASISEEFARLSIKINGRELNQYTNFSKKEDKLTIMFEYSTGQVVPCCQFVRFVNAGQVALRVYWSKYKKLKLFREFTESPVIFEPFKFDKNEIILLPGTERDFPIWFKVQQQGNYVEHWEITTLPRIWHTEFRFIISLKGFASISNYDQKIQLVRDEIDRRVRDTSIKDLLNSLVDKGTYCEPTSAYTFNFSQEQLFESQNLVKNVATFIPKYVYNEAVIGELKEYYEKIRCPEDPEKWDLSIRTLIELARKKDLLKYFEDRVALYKMSKEKRKALEESNDDTTKSKTGTKKENVKKDTKKGKDAALIQPKERYRVETYYDQLHAILRKLQKPSIFPNKDRKKYFFCYIVLKTLTWKMFDQLDQLSPGQDKQTPTNKRDSENPDEADSMEEVKKVEPLRTPIPDRLLFETFEESYVLKTKRIPHVPGASGAKPKPQNLKGIASSDFKKIFKTYFTKEEASQKVGKGRENREIKPPKGKKAKSQNNQDENLYLSVNQDFDPFDGEFDFKGPLVSKPKIEDFSTPEPLKSISHDKYLLVYTTLCTAVDIIVETIDAFNEQIINSDILGSMQKCYPTEASTESDTLDKPSVSKHSQASNILESQKEKNLTNSQTDYFDFLRETHWEGNMNTQKYFIEQKTKSLTTLYKSKSSAEVMETKLLENRFSVEDFKRNEEPYCLKERGIQTFGREEEDNQNNLQSLLSSDRLSLMSSQASSSKNMFYFLGDKVSNITISTFNEGNTN